MIIPIPLGNPKIIQALDQHKEGIWSIVKIDDKSFASTGQADDFQIFIWDASNLEKLKVKKHIYTGHSASIYCLRLLKNDLIGSASTD